MKNARPATIPAASAAASVWRRQDQCQQAAAGSSSHWLNFWPRNVPAALAPKTIVACTFGGSECHSFFTFSTTIDIVLTSELKISIRKNLEHIAATASREDLEKCFVEMEMAKITLREAGFGVTGTPLLQTVEEAIEAAAP